MAMEGAPGAPMNEATPTLFRSQPMNYVRMVMPKEAAQACVRNIGELSAVQFVDVCFAARP